MQFFRSTVNVLKMHKLIISAPFGNYISISEVTSTIGTFTYQKRAGICNRIWKILSTVRYYSKLKEWINKLGLPNPGILSIKSQDCIGKILSIYGFNKNEWENLIKISNQLNPIALEMNFSCPNVNKAAIKEITMASQFALRSCTFPIIAKLPPIRWMDFVHPLYKEGIRWFHLCNTIPTPSGGLSGKVLKQYSLWAIEEVKDLYRDTIIIGGGGITNTNDIDDYLHIGAKHVSIASLLCNPFYIKKIFRLRDYVNKE